MRGYLNKFLEFVVEKKWFFLWFLICFLTDRITTHIILSSGQFIESNLIASKMWSIFGYAASEIFTILFLFLVFFMWEFLEENSPKKLCCLLFV